MQEDAMIEKLRMLIMSHINGCAYPKDRLGAVLQSISILLGENFEITTKEKISPQEFQLLAASLNEKTIKRKVKGVYYTDDDVVEYIVGNAYNCYIDKEVGNVYPYRKSLQYIRQKDKESLKILLDARVFDPTCGTGQFLLQSLKMKCDLLNNASDALLTFVTSTIYGNDIDEVSVKIAMARIFFFIEPKIKDVKVLINIARSLKKKFTQEDYVCNFSKSKQYDIIIGNPPYVEYGKLEKKPDVILGNTYANVLYNSTKQLATKGVMAYIVPLSFVSTLRMKRIRDEIVKQSQKLFVVNFADRPDCLFSSVHQKLTILLAIKGNSDCQVYSSEYYYWYKSERVRLFEECTTYLSCHVFDAFIPKIGCALGEAVFSKVLRTKGVRLVDLQQKVGETQSIYLNMRGTFWTKAFTNNPGSKEYKQFTFPKQMCPYIVSVLNSSLFFFYWSVVSDCWHITSKELDNFRIITDIDITIFENLSQRLLNRLEETKEYIGTVQCDYEYKHRYCKKEIDAIDDALASVYQLSKEELEYVKNYQLKYRMSDER